MLDLRRSEESADEDEGNQIVAGKKKRITKWGANGEGGVQGLDISYDHLERHIQKARDLLQADDGELVCCVCHDALEKDHSLTLVCPHAFCEHTAHITCLAGVFLQQESSGDRMAVLPVRGKCPGCHTETAWVDLVKELSVRTRAKPKKTAVKRKTTKGGAAAAAVQDDDEEDEESENGEGDITAADLAEWIDGEQIEWGDQDADDDSVLSDIGSEVLSKKGGGKAKEEEKGSTKTKKAKKTPLVIVEDSEMDSVISDVGSDTGSINTPEKGKRKVKTQAKGKAKKKAKKAPSAVVEDSDPESILTVGSKTGSAKGVRKPGKGTREAKGKKAIPIVVEDSDPDPALGDTESEMADGKLARKSKKGKGKEKAKGKKKVPIVVVEDSE